MLMNGRIEPDFEVVEPSTLSIIRQTVAAGSQARSRATLAATYAFARANRIGFHLAAIDETAPRTTVATGFDTDYMRRLYRAGHAKARAGSAWRGDIPGTPLVPTISVRTNSVRTNLAPTNLAPTILAAAAGDGDGTTKPD